MKQTKHKRRTVGLAASCDGLRRLTQNDRHTQSRRHTAATASSGIDRASEVLEVPYSVQTAVCETCKQAYPSQRCQVRAVTSLSLCPRLIRFRSAEKRVGDTVSILCIIYVQCRNALPEPALSPYTLAYRPSSSAVHHTAHVRPLLQHL